MFQNRIPVKLWGLHLLHANDVCVVVEATGQVTHSEGYAVHLDQKLINYLEQFNL